MTLRCLVVDDSPGFLRSARALLEQQGITVVGVASTGVEALRRTVELDPDVLLLDIDLGAESGFEVAEKLSRDHSLPASRVILISAHAGDDFADLLAVSPVAGFLPKAQLSAGAIRRLLTAGP